MRKINYNVKNELISKHCHMYFFMSYVICINIIILTILKLKHLMLQSVLPYQKVSFTQKKIQNFINYEKKKLLVFLIIIVKYYNQTEVSSANYLSKYLMPIKKV